MAGPDKCFLSRNVQISHPLPPPLPQTKVFSSALKIKDIKRDTQTAETSNAIKCAPVQKDLLPDQD